MKILLDTHAFLWLIAGDITHIGQVAVMPFHHRDPFDRLIVAQALVKSLPIVGRDQAFDSYGVQRLW